MKELYHVNFDPKRILSIQNMETKEYQSDLKDPASGVFCVVLKNRPVYETCLVYRTTETDITKTIEQLHKKVNFSDVLMENPKVYVMDPDGQKGFMFRYGRLSFVMDPAVYTFENDESRKNMPLIYKTYSL